MQTIQKTLLCLVLSLALLFCSVPVLAADMPGPNPNYEEMTLETFLERYPDYAGREDPRFPSGMIPAAIDNPGYVTSNYSGPFTWEGNNNTKIWYLYSGTGSDRVKVTSGGWYHEVKDGNDHWYYLYAVGATKYDGTTSNGEAAIGWEKLGKYWYHFNQYGQMATYWVPVSGVYYYFAPPSSSADAISGYPEGAMLTGAWYLPVTQGSTSYRNYYFNAYGAMQNWYYPLDTSVAANVTLTNAFKEGGHNGIDIAASYGEPVYSSIGGKVVYCDFQNSMGRCVVERTSVIDANGTPLTVRYMHMSKLYVETVTTGLSSTVSTTQKQKIGEVGNTGEVYPKPTTANPYAGTHLHMDVNPHDLWNADVVPSQQYNPAAFFTSVTFSKNGKTPFGSTLN